MESATGADGSLSQAPGPINPSTCLLVLRTLFLHYWCSHVSVPRMAWCPRTAESRLIPCHSFFVPGMGWRLPGWNPATPAARMTKALMSEFGGPGGTLTLSLAARNRCASMLASEYDNRSSHFRLRLQSSVDSVAASLRINQTLPVGGITGPGPQLSVWRLIFESQEIVAGPGIAYQ